MPEIGGGQVWHQERFPFMVRYVTLLGNGTLAMLSDPRQRGSVVCNDEKGKWQWEAAELEARPKGLGYVCQGQLDELLLAEQGQLIERAIEQERARIAALVYDVEDHPG